MSQFTNFSKFNWLLSAPSRLKTERADKIYINIKLLKKKRQIKVSMLPSSVPGRGC